MMQKCIRDWRLEARERGQTLFELVAAIAIGVIIVTSIVAAATLSLGNSNYSKNQANATRYAQEAQEWLRAQKDSSWATFSSKSGATPQTYCLSSLSWPSAGACGASNFISGTYFIRQVVLTTLDASTIEARVTVTWTDGSGTHTSDVSTQFTSWKGS